MRRPPAFRALVVESLEDRLVLSRLGAAPAAATLTPHHVAPATPQAIATAKVGAAYKTFVQSFTNAVNVDLYMPIVSGSGATSMPFFSQQLGQSLVTLDRGVLQAMGHVPAGSPAAVQVRQSILGSDAASLRSRLYSLTMSSMGLGSAITEYQNTALQEIHQNFLRVNQQVTAAVALSTSSPATP
jgi:hypothetical protein